MALSPEILKQALGRATQVYRYLQALDQLRNPTKRQVQEQLWTLWLRELPDHPCVIKRGAGAFDDEDALLQDSSDDATETPANAVLSVSRPELTPAPEPPASFQPWLQPGWDNPLKPPQVLSSPARGAKGTSSRAGATTDNNPALTEPFGNDAKLGQQWDEWQKLWKQWAIKEAPARRTMDLYERLYDLHSQIGRESERLELVLGDGILNWQRSDGSLHHPLLIIRLQLDFDAENFRFSLVETDHPVEFYSTLFRGLSGIEGQTIGEAREETEENLIHPLGGATTDALLQKLVARLDVRGEFIGAGMLQGAMDYPRIARDPIIFLRTRTLGFATALEKILNDLAASESISNALLGVVGIEPPAAQPLTPAVTPPPESFCDGNEDERVLLSKEANLEQLAIAQRLESHGSVLVQGPPGTGKTHTIANLIGHLLAQGKTVLVTSHTTKALGVLREKVVPPLQPLCVSVLESNGESRQQLENSVRSIVERLASSDANDLDKQASVLASRRLQIIKDLHATRQELFHARAGEYRDVVVAGETFSPSDAARLVAKQTGHDDWIPAPVKLGSPLPLSLDEIADLYSTNASLTPEDERDLASSPPVAGQLLNPDAFEQFVEREARLQRQDLAKSADLWVNSPKGQRPAQLTALQERLKRALEMLREDDEWRLAAIAAGHAGESERQIWDSLIELIESVRNEALESKELFLNHGPLLAENLPAEQQETVLAEIHGHLERGGNLSTFVLLTRRTWKSQIDGSLVGKSKPSTVEHFQALHRLARVELLRNNLRDRWQRQMTVLGAPVPDDLGPEPETACVQYVPIIRECLEWQDSIWQPLENELRQAGLDWPKLLERVPPVLGGYTELKRLQKAVKELLPDVIETQCDRLWWQHTQYLKVELGRRITGTDNAPPDKSSLPGRLHKAFRDRDVVGYREINSRLLELDKRQEVAERRRTLLQQMRQVAPTWAKLIETRRPPHDQDSPPGDVLRAWHWRQLHDELDHRDKASIAEIQKKLENITENLRNVTAELIDRLAWAEQVRRTTVPQRKALVGWVQTIKRIGKGTGKRAAKLQAEARLLMNECRSAVPVWVMPLTRVVENFDPGTSKFDVVFIDEASQSDVMGLLAFYLGRQVVVVGDDEQVSPDAVGQNLEDVQHLIDEHLSGIPNATLYDGKYSVYDVALSSFGGTICLREHFRCVPEIINFSNHLSYNGDIKALRDASTVHLKPHVVSYRVESALAQNKVNELEATALASLLIAATEQPEYKDATFGVISMVGIEQAAKIDLLLRHHMEPAEMERRQIVCGNPPHFQGDERDVVFISMVDAPKDGTLSINDRPQYRKRLNVAASRARDQMWVVHSLQPEVDLKNGDLRRRFLEYANDPGAMERAIERGEAHVESEFERLVLRRLIGAGYHVVPQWKVGAFRIDLVVEGEGKRLAVECDGDRYHAMDKLQDDMARQAVLERLGWTFARVRGSEFFRNPDGAMDPVFQKIKSMGITPQTARSGEIVNSGTGNHLIGKIIRRASELREEW